MLIFASDNVYLYRKLMLKILVTYAVQGEFVEIKWPDVEPYYIRTGIGKVKSAFHLAEAIEKECTKRGTEADILVEVNVAQEASKFGLKLEDTLDLVQKIAGLEHLHIKGLMTIAPFVENSEENRSIFRQLKQLSVDIRAKNIDNVDMDELSMGMTGDYEVAIEEGATMVRVGTGIFGKRNYQI